MARPARRGSGKRGRGSNGPRKIPLKLQKNPNSAVQLDGARPAACQVCQAIGYKHYFLLGLSQFE